MPWVDGDNLTPTNLNNTVPSWNVGSGLPEQFVLTSGGDNTSDGSSWASAKASVQSAYDALPSTGGIIYLGAGRHDVGSGVVLTKDKTASFIGVPRFNRRANEATTTVSEIYSTSTPTALVSLADGSGVNNHYGGHFKWLHFEIDNETTIYAIQGSNWNHCVVEDCSFNVADSVTGEDQVAIRVNVAQDTGDDASWWRVFNNHARAIPLFHSGSANSIVQDNQHVVKDNVLTGPGKTSNASAAIRLNGNHRSIVRDNNIEGYPVGIYLDGSWQCTVEGNAGESVASFCVMENACSGNWINNPGTSNPAATDTICEFTDTNVRSNILVAASLTGSKSLYSSAAVVDSANGENTVITPSDFQGHSNIQFAEFLLRGKELSVDPDAPAANNGVLYFRDSGGSTQLVARFATGSVQVIATEQT